MKFLTIDGPRNERLVIPDHEFNRCTITVAGGSDDPTPKYYALRLVNGNLTLVAEDVDVWCEAIKATFVKVAHAALEDNLGDLRFWSRQEWLASGNLYGGQSLMTITFEGPVNHLMNTGTSFPDDVIKAFDTIGVRYELGYAWSMHVYLK